MRTAVSSSGVTAGARSQRNKAFVLCRRGRITDVTDKARKGIGYAFQSGHV